MFLVCLFNYQTHGIVLYYILTTTHKPISVLFFVTVSVDTSLTIICSLGTFGTTPVWC